MAIELLAPRDVETTLNYYQPKGTEPPYHYTAQPPPGVPSSTVSTEPHPAIIHDARDKQGALGLDVSGFQWETCPSAETEFVDDEQIKTTYYAEVEDILKKYAGAKRVFIFDHVVRRAARDTEGAKRKLVPTERGPLLLVHADQTPAGSEQRVRNHLPEDAERLLKGRYQIVNVWRPIEHVVARYPLGLADFRTVDVDEDVVLTRILRPHFQGPNREGQSYSVKYNPGHKWYYLSDQTPDEVTLIKCFDSDTRNAFLTPHSAFEDRTSSAEAPHRQSIEVRALVFDRE